MKNKRIAAAMMAALVGTLPSAPAWAGEREDIEALRMTTLRLLQLMQERGLLPRSEVEKLLKEASAAPSGGPGPSGSAAAGAAAGGAAGAATGSRTVRVPYVPETVRNQMKEEIRQEVLAQAKEEGWANPGALPSWLGRFTFEGDVRVRSQWNRYADDNAPATFYQSQTQGPATGVDLTNTTEDNDPWSLRARFGAIARLGETWISGIRISTGGLTGPASTSQTLGSSNGPGYLNRYSLSLDRAYVAWRPWLGAEAAFGRIPNPYFSTDLIYSEDLNFDGAAVAYRPPVTFEEPLKPFLAVGAYSLKWNSSAEDRYLYGAQVGFAWAANSVTQVKLGAAVYEFSNIQGVAAPPGSAGSPNYGVTQYPQGVRTYGNTLFNIADPTTTDVIWGLASRFRPVAITGAVEVSHFDPVRVILTGEYVYNTAFDESEIQSQTGLSLPKENRGYQGRLAVGMPLMAARGEWLAFLGYRRLEANAVLDAFPDTTWHLAGTNHVGYQIGGQYALDPNVWLALRWTSADQISGPPYGVDVLQLDLNARF